MTWMVVSDIFGRPPAVEKLCRDLPYKTDLVDPFKGRFMNFACEADAYACFMENVGMDATHPSSPDASQGNRPA